MTKEVKTVIETRKFDLDYEGMVQEISEQQAALRDRKRREQLE